MGVFVAHLQINRSKCMLSVYWRLRRFFDTDSMDTVNSKTHAVRPNQNIYIVSFHAYRMKRCISQLKSERGSTREMSQCVSVFCEITVMVISARRTSLSIGLCVHCSRMIINCIRPFNQAISISTVCCLSNASKYKQCYASERERM